MNEPELDILKQHIITCVYKEFDVMVYVPDEVRGQIPVLPQRLVLFDHQLKSHISIKTPSSEYLINNNKVHVLKVNMNFNYRTSKPSC